MSIVHLKNRKNGVTYVYESTGYWDKEKKQARNHRKCIGKLNDETGEIIYSKKYLESKEIETKTVPVKCKRNFYGATYLLDQISKKLGITHNLKRCFPDNYKKILSLAYYLVMEDRNPMSRFSKWSRTHKHPYGKDIPSQRSSELLGTISEHGKQTFFRLQSKRRQEEEYLAYDTTSISSYSKSLKQVKYGLNKDHDPLPQINLALLFGETSRLPVYYRKLPGNISDVKTIKNMLSDIDFLQLKKVKLVLDRGFYSKSNIDALYQKHHKFLIALKTSLKIVKQKLDEIGGIASRPFYSSKYSIYYTSLTTYWNYTKRSEKKRIYLHIFYNKQRTTDDKSAFNRLLDTLEDELLSGRYNPKHEKLYRKYYKINKLVITPRQDLIDEHIKYYGYFALLSNGIKDPFKALDIYRSKDLIEKAFDNLKERLNMRRTSVSSEENLDGKLFIQFIGLIYLSYIKKAMGDHDLFKKYTMQALLDELDIIELFEQPGKRCRIGEITKKQQTLFECLGVEIPT